MIVQLTYIAITFIIILFIGVLTLRFKLKNLKQAEDNKQMKDYGKILKIVAFFHPYCDAAGGGEKVLWCFVVALLQDQKFKDNHQIVIYTGDQVAGDQILQKANDRFNLPLQQYASHVKFVYVPKRHILEPTKFMTMLSQIIGTIYYTYLCLSRCVPDIFFDTTGFPFSYFVVAYLCPQARIAAYVHYPFISPDMIKQVKENVKRYNNSGRIADSKILTQIKLIYYRILLYLYSLMGRYVNLAFVNSTWTGNHMKQIWGQNIKKLFPPCSVENYLRRKQFPSDPIIVSFAQFRPEKNHMKQINIIKNLVNGLPDEISSQVKVIIIGSCRNEDDQILLDSLDREVQRLNLQNVIRFVKNPQYSEIVSLLTNAMIGIHTMEYEHFGITLVEMMAAGLIVVAHNSAGPKMDIIKDEDHGFLCQSEEDFLTAIVKVLQMTNDERNIIIRNSRKRAVEFSEEAFIQQAKKEFLQFVNNQ